MAIHAVAGVQRDDVQADVTFKILVLGDSSVGKTCLICRFCENNFIDTGSHASTVGKYGHTQCTAAYTFQ